jgi:methionyl-tRNA formyltransferase
MEPDEVQPQPRNQQQHAPAREHLHQPGDGRLKQDITPDNRSASRSQRPSELGGALLLHALQDLARGSVERRPQPAEGVSYARKIDKADMNDGSHPHQDGQEPLHRRVARG